MTRIIPAIDIIEGKCVRLTQGDYNLKTIYDSDPLSRAQYFEDHGFERLHLVDLDGAREKKIINWRVLENITSNTLLKVDFGGGLHTDDDVETAFNCGAQQITAGSIAVVDEDLALSWLQKYGNDKIILGADVRNEIINIHGWQEETNINLIRFLYNYFRKGIRHTICTDITRDGVLKGPALDLYRKIKFRLPDLYLIASGGVSTIEDINALISLDVEGIIIGKAFYEGKIKPQELKAYLC
jgi:phosphoribosylformimino-5-aminoimidazole carboxamide ribotide isomerase